MTKTFKGMAKFSPFHLLCAFLVLVFFTGGSARADVASLVLLRPIAVVIFGAGLLTLNRKQVHAHRYWFSLLLAVFCVVALHLVPLPYAIWSNLPGHGLLVDIDRAAGVAPIWRPLSMVPVQTENALYSLFVPAAVLVLAVQLNEDELLQTVPFLLVLGLVSGLLGTIQSIGSGSSTYFYRVTNVGSAVGLFANRNHQALFLSMLFPILAMFASMRTRSQEKARLRRWLSIACAIALVPLLLVTGSRAGIVLGTLGIAFAVAVYQPHRLESSGRRAQQRRWPVLALAAFGVLAAVAVSVGLSRSEALDRLFSSDTLEADRLAFWPVILETAGNYFPFGSGFGSFVEVYQVVEPDRLLRPQYLNHAHNDWLELWMTGGIPAAALIICFLLVFVRLAKPMLWGNGLRGSSRSIGRLGGSLILLILIASLVDYPLRTPIIASVFVLAAVWMSGFSGVRVSAGARSAAADTQPMRL